MPTLDIVSDIIQNTSTLVFKGFIIQMREKSDKAVYMFLGHLPNLCGI